MSNPISGPYTSGINASLYTNEETSFVVVSSANSPFTFTGSFANTLGYAVINPAGVEISGSLGFAITGSSLFAGTMHPVPVRRVVASGAGSVLVLVGR